MVLTVNGKIPGLLEDAERRFTTNPTAATGNVASLTLGNLDIDAGPRGGVRRILYATLTPNQ